MTKFNLFANRNNYALLCACSIFAFLVLPISTNAQEVGDVSATTSIASLENVPKPFDALPELNVEQRANLLKAVESNIRIDKKRDIYRHPVETLAFFGIKPSDNVIEIWPGQGWYSTILAQYLKTGNGKLFAAHFDTSTTNSQLVKDMVGAFKTKYETAPDIYGNVETIAFGPKSKPLGAKDSVDAVLTFRNIHNWLNQGWADKAFDDFFFVLKPGGVLGIEEHRASEDDPQDPMAADGYVREDYVIDMAKEAGFVFIGKSNINANPKDTRDHPFGVWTLPPVGRTAPSGQPANQKFDQSKYMAIGESDRMTLLFKKPFPPPVTVAKINPKDKKFNPVKVVFGNKKPQLPVSETKVAQNVVKADPLPSLEKPLVRDEAAPVVGSPIESNPSSVPVKFATKAKTNIEKQIPPVVETPILQKTTEKAVDNKPQIPDFSIPDWVDTKTPNVAPVAIAVVNPPKAIENVPAAQNNVPTALETAEKTKPIEVVTTPSDAPLKEASNSVVNEVVTSPKPEINLPSTPPLAAKASTKVTVKPQPSKVETNQFAKAIPAKAKNSVKEATASATKVEKITQKPAQKVAPKQETAKQEIAKQDIKKVETKKPSTAKEALKKVETKNKEVQKAAVKKVSSSTPKTTPKTTSKTVAAPSAKPATKSAAKVAPKPTTKAVTKPVAKPTVKATTKPATKASAKANPNIPDWVVPSKKKK